MTRCSQWSDYERSCPDYHRGKCRRVVFISEPPLHYPLVGLEPTGSQWIDYELMRRLPNRLYGTTINSQGDAI